VGPTPYDWSPRKRQGCRCRPFHHGRPALTGPTPLAPIWPTGLWRVILEKSERLFRPDTVFGPAARRSSCAARRFASAEVAHLAIKWCLALCVARVALPLAPPRGLDAAQCGFGLRMRPLQRVSPRSLAIRPRRPGFFAPGRGLGTVGGHVEKHPYGTPVSRCLHGHVCGQGPPYKPGFAQKTRRATSVGPAKGRMNKCGRAAWPPDQDRPASVHGVSLPARLPDTVVIRTVYRHGSAPMVGSPDRARE